MVLFKMLVVGSVFLIYGSLAVVSMCESYKEKNNL